MAGSSIEDVDIRSVDVEKRAGRVLVLGKVVVRNAVVASDVLLLLLLLLRELPLPRLVARVLLPRMEATAPNMEAMSSPTGGVVVGATLMAIRGGLLNGGPSAPELLSMAV